MISKDILYFADVCAGPGGFSEYILWRRFNCPFDSQTGSNDAKNVQTSNHNLLGAKGFGLTLADECDFRMADFMAGPPEAFMAHYGPAANGDITEFENLVSFASFVEKETLGLGVQLLMADGVGLN